MSTVSRIPPMEHQDSADHQNHVHISRFLLIILCISFPHPITMCDHGFPTRVALNCIKHIGHFLLDFEGSSLKRSQFYEAAALLDKKVCIYLIPGLKGGHLDIIIPFAVTTFLQEYFLSLLVHVFSPVRVISMLIGVL